MLTTKFSYRTPLTWLAEAMRLYRGGDMTRQACHCCSQRVLQREATNTFVGRWPGTCSEPAKEKLSNWL